MRWHLISRGPPQQHLFSAGVPPTGLCLAVDRQCLSQGTSLLYRSSRVTTSGTRLLRVPSWAASNRAPQVHADTIRPPPGSSGQLCPAAAGRRWLPPLHLSRPPPAQLSVRYPPRLHTRRSAYALLCMPPTLLMSTASCCSMATLGSLAEALSRVLVCVRKVARAELFDIEPSFPLQLRHVVQQATDIWASDGAAAKPEITRCAWRQS